MKRTRFGPINISQLNSFHQQQTRLNGTKRWEKSDGTQQIKGTGIIFFIQFYKVPKGRKVTYIRKVFTYRPDKLEQNRTRFTAMGNFITDFTAEISTKTTGLELIKMHRNSVLSKKKLST